MIISQHLYTLCNWIGSAHSIPLIKQVLIAKLTTEPKKSTKFGAVVLEDGTVGITYVGLDDVWHELQKRPERETIIGTSPLIVAEWYTGEEPWQRVLGMSAINAISQWYFDEMGVPLEKMPKLTEALSLNKDDHVGMVGFFPPLVDKLDKLGCRLTVLELDSRWLENDKGVKVTLDPPQIESCNKIICTGTTLVNHSLDSILDHCQNAEAICVMGPTAGCIPDPLFMRGVTHIGGSRVIDTDAFIHRWSNGEHWRDATSKYLVSKGTA